MFTMSPPFRSLEVEEDEEIVKRISDSGARMLFVGLGCPKQERWIMEHRGRIAAVMFGVGAAFDFLAGSKRQAPRWIDAQWAGMGISALVRASSTCRTLFETQPKIRRPFPLSVDERRNRCLNCNLKDCL